MDLNYTTALNSVNIIYQNLRSTSTSEYYGACLFLEYNPFVGSSDGCYWWLVINFFHFPAVLFSNLTATQICKEKGSSIPPSTTQHLHTRKPFSGWTKTKSNGAFYLGDDNQYCRSSELWVRVTRPNTILLNWWISFTFQINASHVAPIQCWHF